MIKKLIIILFGTPILFAATLGSIFGVIFYLSFNEISTETAHMVIAESDKKAARELSIYKLKTGNLKIELDGHLYYQLKTSEVELESYLGSIRESFFLIKKNKLVKLI